MVDETGNVSIRLSAREHKWLMRLVALERKKHEEAGYDPYSIRVSQTSFLRRLIARAAKEAGIDQEEPEKTVPSPEPEEGAPEATKAKPARPQEPELRESMRRLMEAGYTLSRIADAAGIPRPRLSEFRAGRVPLSGERLESLWEAIRELNLDLLADREGTG